MRLWGNSIGLGRLGNYASVRWLRRARSSRVLLDRCLGLSSRYPPTKLQDIDLLDDLKLQKSVFLELKSDPSVPAAKIWVTVDSGVVMLAGHLGRARLVASSTGSSILDLVSPLSTKARSRRTIVAARSDRAAARSSDSAISFNRPFSVCRSLHGASRDNWQSRSSAG